MLTCPVQGFRLLLFTYCARVFADTFGADPIRFGFFSKNSRRCLFLVRSGVLALGAQRGGGPNQEKVGGQRVRGRRVGGPKVRGPKILRFFFPLSPLPFSLFFSLSLWVSSCVLFFPLSWNSGGVFEGRDPNVHI